jgi:hypothetical protein
MMRFILTVLALVLSTQVKAQTYAVPNGSGGYTYLPADTPLTFMIGELSFPPAYLKQATPSELASRGILQVIETPQPDPTKNTVTGSSIKVVNGVPTVVWDYEPLPPVTTTPPVSPAVRVPTPRPSSRALKR